MTTGIRSSEDGSKSYIAVGGTDRVTIDAATGKLTSTYSPPTGERSLALATMQKFADEFGASLATSGYQKLPSGLIIQWVSTTESANSVDVKAWPIAFPNAVYIAAGNATTNPADAVTFPTLATNGFVAMSGGIYGSTSIMVFGIGR